MEALIKRETMALIEAQAGTVDDAVNGTGSSTTG